MHGAYRVHFAPRTRVHFAPRTFHVALCSLRLLVGALLARRVRHTERGRGIASLTNFQVCKLREIYIGSIFSDNNLPPFDIQHFRVKQIEVGED